MSSRRRFSASVLLASVLVSLPRLAVADELRTAALNWVRLPGAEACIASTKLAERVEQYLGRAVFVSPVRADLGVEGRVERDASKGWRVSVRIADRDGNLLGAREFERSGPCHALDDQLVLMIALTIDPDAALRSETPEPTAAPAPVAAVDPEPRVVFRDRVVRIAGPSTGRREAERPWSFEGRIASTATAGLLPGITPGIYLAAAVDSPQLPAIELGGIAWFEREVEAGAGGGRFTALGGRLGVCPRVALTGALALAGCGAVDVLALRADGYGFDSSLSATEPLVMLGAMANLVLGSGRIFGQLGVGGMLPVVRAKFTYADAEGAKHELLDMPPVGLSGELGLGFRLSNKIAGDGP